MITAERFRTHLILHELISCKEDLIFQLSSNFQSKFYSHCGPIVAFFFNSPVIDQIVDSSTKLVLMVWLLLNIFGPCCTDTVFYLLWPRPFMICNSLKAL